MIWKLIVINFEKKMIELSKANENTEKVGV